MQNMNEKINKNINAIDDEITLLKKELILQKLKKTTKQEIKPHLIKKIKYQIANILTKQTLQSS